MKPLWRLVDANLNRVKEGLRVSEDLARFWYEDKALTAAFKKLRHDTTKAMLRFPASYRKLVAARDVKGDIGKRSAIRDRKRTSWSDLAVLNLKRAEEGLRVLEEISKIAAPRRSADFQAMRFRAYELEKRVFKKISALRRHRS